MTFADLLGSDLCRGPAATVCPHLPPWLLGSARGGAASSGGQSALLPCHSLAPRPPAAPYYRLCGLVPTLESCPALWAGVMLKLASTCGAPVRLGLGVEGLLPRPD